MCNVSCYQTYSADILAQILWNWEIKYVRKMNALSYLEVLQNLQVQSFKMHLFEQI